MSGQAPAGVAGELDSGAEQPVAKDVAPGREPGRDLAPF